MSKPDGTYAEFSAMGVVVANRTSIPVECRSAVDLLPVWPNDAYAVRFYALVGGQRVDVSGWHFLNGKVYDRHTLPLGMWGRHNVLFTLESATRDGVEARVCETCLGSVVLINEKDCTFSA